MNVLQHTKRIVRHIEHEEFLHLEIPDAGQVVDRDAVFDQGFLYLKSQDDVKIVGDLVRLHAYERRLDRIHRAVERVERNAPQRAWKFLLQQRIKVNPKGPALADQILPEP